MDLLLIYPKYLAFYLLCFANSNCPFYCKLEYMQNTVCITFIFKRRGTVEIDTMGK